MNVWIFAPLIIDGGYATALMSPEKEVHIEAPYTIPKFQFHMHFHAVVWSAKNPDIDQRTILIRTQSSLFTNVFNKLTNTSWNFNN